MASTPHCVAVKIVAEPWRSAAARDEHLHHLPLPASAILPISSSSFPNHILHPSVSDISIHVISAAANSPPYRCSSCQYCSLNVTAPAFTSSTSCCTIDVGKFAIGGSSPNGRSKCGSAAASDHLLPIAMREEYPHWLSDHDDSSSRKSQPPIGSHNIISQCHGENTTSTVSFFHRFSLRRLPSFRCSPVDRSDLQAVLQCGGHLSRSETSTGDRAHEYYYAAAMAMVAASISKWVSIFQHHNNTGNVNRIAPETMLEGSSPAHEDSRKQSIVIGHDVSRMSASVASAFAAGGGHGTHVEARSKKKMCDNCVDATEHDHPEDTQHTLIELPAASCRNDEDSERNNSGRRHCASGQIISRRLRRPRVPDGTVSVNVDEEEDDDGDDAYAPIKTNCRSSSSSSSSSLDRDRAAALQLQQPDAAAGHNYQRLEGAEQLLQEVVRPGEGEGAVVAGVEQKQSSSDDEDETKLWPFLLRFPISCFGICLGLGSQAILWKTLILAEEEATSSMRRSFHLHYVPPAAASIMKQLQLGLWCLSLLALLVVSSTYALKCFFYPNAVRREFCHPVRVNFFFAPLIACMFLTLALPPPFATSTSSLPFLFMAPLLLLELKIYGQWLSGGHKRLSRVANPSTHLSLVGNFVGSHLAASAGLLELATFFWAVGLAHYLVVFVTLYQRLPSAASLPKELHPVFFLFIAAPNSASVAWSHIVGDFDLMARIAYFVGLFLYASLAVRVNLFRGFRFSVAWWAYTFPMTASAIATIHYSLKVTHPITQVMAVALSLISTLTVVSLCVVTILHAFVWRTLFPNDVAIAISMNSGLERQNETEDPQKRKGADDALACNFSMI